VLENIPAKVRRIIGAIVAGTVGLIIGFYVGVFVWTFFALLVGIQVPVGRGLFVGSVMGIIGAIYRVRVVSKLFARKSGTTTH